MSNIGTEITGKEKQKLTETYGTEISRIVTKIIPVINDTYRDISLIDLLMSLPIKFDFAEYDLSQLKPSPRLGRPLTEKDLAIGGYIQRDTEAGNPNRLIVFFRFAKDINTSWDDFFNSILRDPAMIAEAAFVYLHEALHILNRHYDFYLNVKYEALIDQVKPGMSSEEKHELLNHAFDYWQNGFLIEKAQHGSRIYNMRNPGGTACLYDPNLSPDKLQQQEIVQKLAKEAQIEKEHFPGLGTLTSITINGNTSTTFSPEQQHGIEQSRATTEHEQEINDVLNNTREQLLNKTRGEGNSGALRDLGVSYEVPVDWFGLLKSSIFQIVQRYTNNSDQTWGRLKSKYRHIAPMPGRIYYDKQLAAVISIDQSGSMSDDDLRKINYVISELAKKTEFVEILLHDTRVAARKVFKGHKPNEIRDFVTTRHACGGTSHKEVFDILDEITTANPKMKLIYMSFSDNYSDIEHVYDENLFRRITPYWITTDERRPVRVPGMQVSLENGLLHA